MSGDGARLLKPNGAPLFLLAMNYEGPGDRAWQMWEDGKFDASLVDADFQRATAAGANALRVFVQTPLAQDTSRGRWDKLDQVVGLAEKRGLQLILTLHDYGERDLAKVSATAGQIAQRYRGRAGILAYDLRNEPRFGDLALARYGSPPPLQQRGLIDAYGERVGRGDIPDLRASDQGTKDIPKYLTDDEAWVYENNLLYYRDFLADGAAWVKGRPGSTTVDFIQDPASARWKPLLDAMNTTFAAWIAPQLAAIRQGDPTKPVTIGHVDAVLASLPANDVLDYQTLHRYPGPGAASVGSTLNLLDSLRGSHPGRPYVLGEFGYATESMDPPRTALHETALLLGLLARGNAGGAKWVLNDMPEGFNMRERTLGAYTLDGAAKPIVGALSALHQYLGVTGAGPGELKLESDPDSSLRYVYRATDSLFLGGKTVDAGSVRLQADGPAQLFLSWTEPGALRLWASASMQVDIAPGKLVGAGAQEVMQLFRVAASGQEQPVGTQDPAAQFKLSLDQPGSYVLRAAVAPRPADYDIPGGHFYTQTNGRPAGTSQAGFSVTDADGIPFWSSYLDLGGPEVLGHPVTRRFQLDGFTVQAFQKAVLQWRPDQGGKMWFLNTFDALHDAGRDDWLEVSRQTPRPFDTKPDGGLPWEQVVARHLGFLDKVPGPLKQRFLAEPEWMDHFGLPVATQDYPNAVVVRAQRATLQFWKQDVPWAKKGEVTVANGGDLAKEAGLWPWLAATPENAAW